MKKRMVSSLLTAITAGSLLLSGCSGLDLANVNQEDTTLSAEMEQENLSDGTIQFHSVWYSADNTPLASATVSFSDGEDELFSGTTDENGNLAVCTLTGNTTLTCKITDSSGETLANAKIACKISDEYESLTVYPVHADSDDEHVFELPSAKTDVRSAIYLTEDGNITVANLSPYYESTDTTADSTEGEAADDGTAADATTTDGTTTDDGSTDSTTTDGTTTDDSSADDTTADGTTTDDGSADATGDGTTADDGTADTTTEDAQTTDTTAE